MPRWLIRILVILLALPLLFAACVGGAAYYVLAPDLPPLRVSLLSLGDKFPFLGPEDYPLASFGPELQQRLDELAPAADPLEEREESLGTQLQSTGLPITGVFILETDASVPVLAVGVDYDKLAAGLSLGGGLGEAVQALVDLVQAEELDLSGLEYMTVIIRDSQGRSLFGVTANVADIERLRNGEITRREFIRSTAARAESRAGILNTIREAVQD